jgi:hypothetical protein
MKPLSISLLVAFIVIGCRKKSSEAARTTSPLSYTSRMAGSRIWHGTAWGRYFHPDSASGYWTYYNNPITDTFAIAVLNDSTIDATGCWGNPLKLTDTAGGVLTFTALSVYPLCKITYYYIGDSIHYEFNDIGIHTDNHWYMATP